MADVTLMGATYSDVPAVDLPSTNGTVRFYDMNELTYVETVNGESGVVTLDIPPTMTILSYGSSTWDDFITAYNSNSVVYCRASSNSNPASGAQTRMAFMAYVNANPPTNVEFQYYRSVSSHSASQQGDQVYIYKLDKTNGWSVTTREAMSKIAAGSNMSSSYSSGTLTLNADSQLPSVTSSDNGKVLAVANGAWSSEELLVPVANGGTGANTAAGALANLGIMTREYSSENVSWAAGTIGTRAQQVSVSCAVDGYTPVACVITYISQSNNYHLLCFFSEDRKTLYFNFYRTTNTAYTLNSNAAKCLVLYMKS